MVPLNVSQFSIWRHHQKARVYSVDLCSIRHSPMSQPGQTRRLVSVRRKWKPWMDVSPLSVFRIVTLHIPPLCQHIYPVSQSMLAVVLTCVSNGRDVSSQGQSSEGNCHYQNRGLLVAQQEEVWVGGRGSYSPILNPCSGLFGGRR